MALRRVAQAARTEKAIVLSSPGAYGEWRSTCCLPELNVSGQSWKHPGLEHSPGPLAPSQSGPRDSKTWGEGVESAVRRDQEKQFPLSEQPRRALSPLNHIPWFLYDSLNLCSAVFNCLWPHELYATRLLCRWNFPSQNTGVGCHFFLQESSQPRDWIRVTCISCISRQILYQLHY